MFEQSLEHVHMISILLMLFCSSRVMSDASAAPNVILITLDGVRYHEIFEGVRMPRRAGEKRGTAIVPDVQRIVSEGGFFIGNRPAGEAEMTISNRIGLSQPGYRAILSGEFEDECRSNECPVIDRETIFDRLLDEGLPEKAVAGFASWDVIGRCLESKNPRAVRGVSFDSIHGLSKEEALPFDVIQERAQSDRPPWEGSRYDRYTFEMGLRYLRTYQPRFLYLSFVDTDEYGHLNDYKGYVGSLRDFNQRFVQLTETLKGMGQYGEETSIVVTTDHGRGRGPYLWRKHSREWIDSRRVWAIVLPSKSLQREKNWVKADRRSYFQVDIRPTVEVLLGMEPRRSGEGRGNSLIDVF